MMTLDEIRECSKDVLTPADVCEVLKCDKYSINVRVKEDKLLGVNSFPFPVILLGSRVKIPRKPFLKAMEGE